MPLSADAARRAMERERSSVSVRPAIIADIERCQRLDSSFATNFIWNIDEVVRPDQIQVSLRRVRIPRAMELQDSRLKVDLFHVWQQSRCFLVAEEAGAVLGYLNLTIQRQNRQGSIEHLVVHRPCRRRGVATLLLDGAERWARDAELSGLMVVAQSKNDPAIGLFVKCGLSFRGYVDGYLGNGDLGMVYSLAL